MDIVTKDPRRITGPKELIDMCPAVYLSVDVDRDANRPVPGQLAAASPGGGPSFTASMQGFYHVTRIMADKGVRGSFFFEGECLGEILRHRKGFDAMLGGLEEFMRGQAVGCHGMAHEDLTGTLTGMEVSRDTMLGILKNVRGVVREAFPSNDILGFRAPYLRVNPTVLDAITAAGFQVDSSLTVSLDRRVESREFGVERFVELPGGISGIDTLTGEGVTTPPHHFLIDTPSGTLKEYPLSLIARDGKPGTTYLWPMLEGMEGPEELAQRVLGALDDGDGRMVLALHPWHLIMGVDGVLREKEEGEFPGVVLFKELVKGLLEQGVKFKAMEW